MNQTAALPNFERDWSGVWECPPVYRKAFWDACHFIPNEDQAAILLSGERIKLVTGGERSGKSYITAAEGYIWLWHYNEDDVLWIVGPDYEQARPEFSYLRDMMEASGLLHPTAHVATPRIGSWSMCARNGALVVTKSSADPQTLAGIPPAGVLMVECAQHDHEAFYRLIGRVSQKRGPMLMSGTWETSLGWMPPLWRRWRAENDDDAKSFSLPAWTNKAVYPGGRNDPEIKRLESIYPPDYFMERLGGEPCAPSRLVFREFDPQKHVRKSAEFDPGKKVILAVDPGYAHYYAILAAHVDTAAQKVVVFDEIAEQGRLADDLIRMAKLRPWWPSVHVVVMDRAGKQHLGSDNQAKEWANKTGKRVIMNYVPIDQGILRYHTFLREDPITEQPKLTIHPRCVRYIEEHSLYLNSKDSEGRPISELPIDKDNDCLKAAIYLLIAAFGFVGPSKRQKISVKY